MKLFLALFLIVSVQAHAAFTPTFTSTSTITPTPTSTAIPTLNPQCAYQDSSVVAGVAENYGTWDGVNVWFTDQTGPAIYKIAPGITMTATIYSLTYTAKPLCMAYDGANLWIGGSDSNATLYKYSTSGSYIGSWETLPAGNAQGGIQGILWDGSRIWLGISITPTAQGGGAVCRWNTSTAMVDLSVTGQNNVNGISYYIDSSSQEWILAACALSWSKINATTGSYGSIADNGDNYRLTNDGTYVYFCQAGADGNIQKFNLYTGALVGAWQIGTYLNQITYAPNQNQLWTVGADMNTNVTDTNGNPLCFYYHTGASDVVYAYNLGAYGTMFTLNSNNNAGTPPDSSAVYRYALSSAPFTATSTATPLGTATPTPTVSPTWTVTRTVSPTTIPTSNATRTFTQSSTETFTVSPTPTDTPNWTATATPTYNAIAPTASPTIGFP